jgi:hypothetical protein
MGEWLTKNRRALAKHSANGDLSSAKARHVLQSPV